MAPPNHAAHISDGPPNKQFYCQRRAKPDSWSMETLSSNTGYMSSSLNSLQGSYRGDYIVEYYRVINVKANFLNGGCSGEYIVEDYRAY